MKKLFPVLCFLLTALPVFAFQLVKDRKPAAVFISSPSVPLRHIDAFNQFLKECSGTALPVEKQGIGGKNEIRFNIEKRSMENEDDFSIAFPEKNVMLITGSEISVRWALNRILEDFAGVRFVFPGKNGAHCPKFSDLDVPEKTIAVHPSFNLYREFYFNEPEWGACLNEKQWNSPNFFNHNMWRIFPAEKYSGPEWIDKVMPLRNGKRFVPEKKSYSLWQPCFGNPATVDEAVKNINEYLDAHPSMKTYSLAINDLGGFCECENCLKQNGGSRKNVFQKGYGNFSNLFYAWAGKVIDGVLKKHPDIFFGCCAYREVSEPPDFPIHKNLIPVLAIDLYSMCDKAARASHERYISAWKAKAPTLGFWEYGYGLTPYSLPRIYFGLQAEILKYYHASGGRVLFVESQCYSDEGPKRYLYSKLAFDVNADPHKLLKEWYEACVGKEAAPVLAEYYRLFNDFWLGDRVRRTTWFQPFNIYLPLDRNGAYLYAFSENEMKKSRQLIEKVVSLANQYGDEKQKRRAAKIRLYHDYYEALALKGGSTVMPLSGKIATAAEAVSLIEKLPVLFQSTQRLIPVSNQLADLELAETYIVPRWHKQVFDKLRINKAFCPVILFFDSILPFTDDPAVCGALEKLAANPEIPEPFQRQTRGFIVRNAAKNLLSDSFSPEDWKRSYAATVSREKGPDGKLRFKVTSKGGWTAAVRTVPMNPGRNYLVRITVSFSGSAQESCAVRPLLSAVRDKDGMAMQSYHTETRRFSGGKPYTFEHAHFSLDSSAFAFSKGVVYVIFPELRKNQSVFIDSMELFDITGPPGETAAGR